MVTRRRVCPVCTEESLTPFVRRSRVPIHQNLALPTRHTARLHPRGELDLHSCGSCGFVTNLAFEPGRMVYDEAYDNRQDLSPAFDAHLDRLVDRLVASGVRGCRVVEVGCGQGTFLERLCEAGDNMGVGFDPAYRGPLDPPGPVRFEQRYYGADCASVPADVVVCRHVIEHLPDPVALASAVREALTGSPHARVVFETPDLRWILDGVVFQDLFYEHCSYFTPDVLRFVFVRAGFTVDSVEHVFGGQYLWLEARVAERRTSPVPTEPALGPALERFATESRQHAERWRHAMAKLNRDGPIAVWGAGAKGVTFLNMVDPEGHLATCVVDINPAKQGRFVPGTGHPIVGVDELHQRQVRHAVLMNPNYRDEIAELLEEHGLDVVLHAPETP